MPTLLLPTLRASGHETLPMGSSNPLPCLTPVCCHTTPQHFADVLWTLVKRSEQPAVSDGVKLTSHAT